MKHFILVVFYIEGSKFRNISNYSDKCSLDTQTIFVLFLDCHLYLCHVALVVIDFRYTCRTRKN